MLHHPNALRARFARALSDMYRAEVPDYGTLVDLVEQVNADAVSAAPGLRDALTATGELARLSDERHGAIRVGTPDELAGMRRLFAGLGMAPVGCYDLAPAGIPVHSTAFRAVSTKDLAQSPFRVFCSLLQPAFIVEEALRGEAEAALARRAIFHPDALRLADAAQAGLTESEAGEFIDAALETFRWHEQAAVSHPLYERLSAAHRLIADVVSFKGPHINHLTPRTLDIDAVQRSMPAHGIAPKAVVEGPPPREAPILLRQTSFKAIEERVVFPGENGDKAGAHTARFGEIEQRGAALTPRGRALYDRLLDESRARCKPAADGSNAQEYEATLAETFQAFPDNETAMRKAGLAYWHYSLAPGQAPVAPETFETAVADGRIRATPITYEDFLPVSAAGIFQSNLGDDAAHESEGAARATFEAALGCAPLDEFALYARNEDASREACMG